MNILMYLVNGIIRRRLLVLFRNIRRKVKSTLRRQCFCIDRGRSKPFGDRKIAFLRLFFITVIVNCRKSIRELARPFISKLREWTEISDKVDIVRSLILRKRFFQIAILITVLLNLTMEIGVSRVHQIRVSQGAHPVDRSNPAVTLVGESFELIYRRIEAIYELSG